MNCSLSAHELRRHLENQLDSLFSGGEGANLSNILEPALERTEYCFEQVALPGYTRDGKAFLNHLHGDQSAVLIYFLSNEAFKHNDNELASKLFLLNKMRNGLVCMYDTELPSVFLLVHTVGMMLGKAQYGERFVCFQNVTIGSDKGQLPRIDEGVVVYGGSMVVGECDVGARSVIAGNSTVIHQSVPANHIVSGRSPDLVFSPRRRDILRQYFK